MQESRQRAAASAITRTAGVFAAVAALFAFSCSSSSGPDQPANSGNGGLSGAAAGVSGNAMGDAGAGSSYAAGDSPGASGEAGTAGGSSQCTPVRSAHAIPARAALYASVSTATEQVKFVSELAGRVDGFCAGCHRAPASQGNFSYTAESFVSALPATAVERILNPDVAKRMPPASPFPVREDLKALAADLQAWFDQGRPTVTYKPAASAAEVAAGSTNPYAFDERAGRGLTNLGDCIPSKEIIGAGLDKDDEAREARFAAISSFEDLPKKLSQTDLFTLDTETLARHNTVAVAPSYQLWSFDAGKLRYLHLPPKTSLRYDPTLKTFVTPPNTRLYKTFSKPVTDKSGQVGWRKMETRLIISRHDIDTSESMEDQAVFGTYIWNEQETEATLLEKPYLGTNLDDPHLNTYTFKDLIIPYVEDERVFSKSLENVDNHSGNVVLRPLPGQKEYPVPGWHRCEQCHQGSPTKDFLLGINPMQLNRRPLGEGGVYEEVGPDELTQAQRLLDYGFITGLKSPDEFIKLEDSAGDRKPRNAYELRAQAYVVGNCAGCHNPRGYPTRLNPSLADFNFLPGGSVFQFPLTQKSPLRISGSVGLSYIDPVLSERVIDEKAQADNATTLTAARLALAKPTTVPPSLKQNLGPWKSLIYRNVQTPRTYAERGDTILYPHMPLHVAGIDCRAQTIIGSWIASIATGRDETGQTIVESNALSARAEADERVRSFLAQQPKCEPAQDLRDWGADAPNFTDARAPWEIPDRPHWFEEDFTEVLGDFQPRNGKWRTALLLDKYAFIRDFEPSAELQAFVEKEVPFDFWKDKPECDFSSAPTPAALPYWAVRETRAASPSAGNNDLGQPQRLYSTLPGAAVFGAICSNCHGQRGTAVSNLASTIANLTGGKTRVANYAQGFFGPLRTPTQNLSYFTQEKLADGSSLGEFGAAKYLLFMALGGTEAVIPQPALNQVAAAKVAAETRPGTVTSFASANMLEVAKEVCANTIQYETVLDAPIEIDYDVDSGLPKHGYSERAAGIAVLRNGEFLLYRDLCAIDNPRPVRMLEFSEGGSDRIAGFFDRSTYKESGATWSGTDQDPWCVSQASLVKPNGAVICRYGNPDSNAAAAWVQRGVRNVGFSVYAYLKRAFADPSQWRPTYDQCELRYPRK